MSDDVETEFQQLKAIVKTLEDQHPEQVVIVIEQLEVGGLPQEREQAVLHRLTLKRGTSRIWVTVSDSARCKVGPPFLWDSHSMSIDVSGNSRSKDWLPVDFTEAP